jgi:hypothetical protein
MSCFVLFKDEAGCGEFMGQNNLERLSNCNQDFSAHLRRYHLSKEFESLSESDLILLRVEFPNVHGDFRTGKYACALETLRQSWSLLELEE